MSNINIASIRVNGGTQSRAGISRETVAEYAEAMRGGAAFPPLVVFYDGDDYWLADGFHRYHAYAEAGAHDVPADVRQGSQRDAVLFSVGANAAHGLRRTNDDKRRAVMTLLNDAEWSAWSDREIARACGVSQPFVSGIRPRLTDNVISEDRTYTTKHGTEATMKTANIGAGSKPDQKPQALVAKAESADEAAEIPADPAPDQEAQGPEAPPREGDAAAKLRKQLRKLTPEALVEDAVEAAEARAQDRATIAALRADVVALKAKLAEATEGDLGRNIGILQKRLANAEYTKDQALRNAVIAERKARILEARVKELEQAGIALN